jgi:YfiH family protein
MITAPNFEEIEWLEHGFGLRGSPAPAEVRTVRQIHSAIVLDADRLDAVAAEGTPERQGDALVSGEAGVCVGIRTADCVPVLLVDTETRVVAAIHAGWRGSAENISAAAVGEMARRWGSRPGNIRAAIGPSIGVCCYEVGADVARRFGTWIPEMERAEGPMHLDLPAINEIQLRMVGVGDVWKSGECTFCSASRFFSFRRERERAGRMLSFIGLQKHYGRTR